MPWIPAITARSKDIIHVQTGHVRDDNDGGWHDFIPLREDPKRAKADCGWVGEIEEVNFALDHRRICGRCLFQNSREAHPDRA